MKEFIISLSLMEKNDNKISKYIISYLFYYVI